MPSLLYINDRLLGNYGGEAPQHLNSPFSGSQLAIPWAVRFFFFFFFFYNLTKCVFAPTSLMSFSRNVG